ncbi:MAG: hypothetical protein LBU56_02465 [Rickettsiales bacterium]|jgi:hypothetical protein|nr:hypothetical protein [Rickettsiales bacterium]
MTDDTLKIDKEFLLITPSRSRGGLDANPIYVWDKTILDGYEKYEICVKAKISLQIEAVSICNRQEAIIWICKKQLERDDLPAGVRRFLIGKRYIAENKLASDRIYKKVLRSGAKQPYKYMGQEYGLSPDQLNRYRMYARALEKLSGVVPAIYEKIMEGSIILSVKPTIKYSKLSVSDIRALSTQVLEKPDALIKIIREKYAAVRLAAGKSKKERVQVAAVDITAVIKQDSSDEVLSLASTVPAWTKAIGRVITSTDFSCVSESALYRLTNELLQLTAAINTVNRIVEEHKNVGRN